MRLDSTAWLGTQTPIAHTWTLGMTDLGGLGGCAVTYIFPHHTQCGCKQEKGDQARSFAHLSAHLSSSMQMVSTSLQKWV